MFSLSIFESQEEDNLLLTKNIEDFNFSTSEESGGYERGKFSLSLRDEKPISFWFERHAVVYDFFGDRIFEGRTKKPRISGDTYELEVIGYFDEAGRVSAGPMYFSGRKKGALVEISIAVAGSGYALDDVVDIAGGTNGQARVSEVDGSGVVQEIFIENYGEDYSTGRQTTSGGSGTGLEISIDLVETGSTAYDIIKFLVDLNPYWKDDFSRLSKLDRIPIGPFTYTRETTIEDALKEIAEYGYLDSEDYSPARRRQFFFGVYNNRIPVLQKRADIEVDEPDWLLSVHNILKNQEFTLRGDSSRLVNHIFVTFNDPDLDGATTTPGKKDRDSIERYGLKQEVISIGEANEDTALLVEELAIEQKTQPSYSSTIRISGDIRDKNGVEFPLWKIKAGDLIKLTDIDTALLGLSGEKLGAIAYVTQTRYDDKSKTMTVTLGSGKRLDMMLKRLGVS